MTRKVQRNVFNTGTGFAGNGAREASDLDAAVRRMMATKAGRAALASFVKEFNAEPPDDDALDGEDEETVANSAGMPPMRPLLTAPPAKKGGGDRQQVRANSSGPLKPRGLFSAGAKR